MSTEDRSARTRLMESRIHSAAPPEPDDVDFDAVRTRMPRVRKRAPRRATGRLVGATLAALALLLAVAFYVRAPQQAAFAYETAANALVTQDGVVHVIVVPIGLEPDPTPIECAAAPPEDAIPPWAEEFWLDSAGQRIRQEENGPANADVWCLATRITSDGYTTMRFDSLDAAGTIHTETNRIAGLDYDEPTAVPAWIEQLAAEVRAGNCGVSEETTDGVAVWRISWDHTGVEYHTGAEYELHTETVVRQSDYRPLTIEYTFTSASDADPGRSAMFEVVEWEILPYEDVPVELFDPDVLLEGANAEDGVRNAGGQIRFLADDPELFEFSEFPVWYLGDDGRFGSITGTEYDMVTEADLAAVPPMLRKGAYTFVYGLDEIVGAGSTITPMDGYLVTTYAETSPGAAYDWWAQTAVWGECTSGSLDGVRYTMCAGSDRATALVIMDGLPVTVSARDEASVFAAVRALQPLRRE